MILFVALTGRLPLQGPPRSVLARKLTEAPPRASELAEGVPADLDALCADLLRCDPCARPTGRSILARLSAAAPAEQSISHIEVVEPGPELAAGSAASGAIEVSVGPVGPIPLIGRERHLEALRDAYELVRRGRPEVVLVSGRSGSGKSTLLQAFFDGLGDGDEAVVLAGRCYERESVPYKALDSVVDALSRYLKPLPLAEAQELLPRDVAYLARVFPVLQRVEAIASAPRPEFEIPDQQELRRRAFAALRELLAQIGRRKTLVVAIDDLQWADPENAPLVTELVRSPDAPLMLLLGSFRTEDMATSPFLRILLGTGNEESTTRLSIRFHELPLGALSQGESRALALALLGRDDALALAEAHLIAREAQGNPFLIDELIKHVQAGGGLAKCGPSPGSLTLDEVLWTRVSRLSSDEAKLLLALIAVAGRPISQGIAFQAALGAAGLGTARSAVGSLRSARLIRSAGPARHEIIEVYHDRIRESVVAHLPGDLLHDLHRRLAETLEASGQADPEVLAVHHQGAAQFEKASHYFERAADRAAGSLAFMHAARLYRRALELRGNDNARRMGSESRADSRRADPASLHRKLGDALANAGRGGEAARAYLEATAGAQVAEVLELKRRATMQLLISGRVDEGLAALHELLGTLGLALPWSPQRSLVWLVVRRAFLAVRGYGFQRRDTSQLSAELLTRIDLCWSAATGLSIIDPICGAEFQSRGLLLALQRANRTAWRELWRWRPCTSRPPAAGVTKASPGCWPCREPWPGTSVILMRWASFPWPKRPPP